MKINGSTQVQAGTLTRPAVNVATTGAALVTKALPGTGLTSTQTGVDAGTGDVTLNLTGALPTNTVKIGDTTPAGVAAGAQAYSTVAKCVVVWSGAAWGAASALPPFASVLNAAFIDGGMGVNCGSVSDGGSLTSLGTLTGNVLITFNLGTVP